MKRTTIFMITAFILLAGISCGNNAEEPVSENESIIEATSVPKPSEEYSEPLSEQVSETISEEVSTEMKKQPVPENAHIITNLNYNNNGAKMGDADGPAYCVYSKKGYNKASMDIMISGIKMNNVRASDGKYVNAYIFLGADVYSGQWWVNCFDTGFCYSGANGAWHLFYNIYEAAEEGQVRWYESKVKLSSDHDYRLILDTSEEDQKATVMIYDITDDKLADQISFGVKNLKSDGSNTSYLQDFALDYPQNVKKDRSGQPSENFEEITLYNTDQDIYMQNIAVKNVKIFKSGTEYDWDNSVTDHRALWPDMTQTVFDYACTKVITESEDGYDHDFRVDLDMNRE